MDIHLIDEFRRRTNASYDEARMYLERFNGDCWRQSLHLKESGPDTGRREIRRPAETIF